MSSRTKKRIVGIVLVLGLLLILLVLIGGSEIVPVPTPPNPAPTSNPPTNALPPSVMTVGIIYEDATPTEDTQETENGVAPQVWASYRESIGFRRYYEEMVKRGVVFFAYSRQQGQWVTVGPKSRHQAFDPASLGTILAAAPTCIRNEPALRAELTQLDVPDYKVYVVKPLQLEKTINLKIARALKASGIAINTVTGIAGRYQLKHGKLILELTHCAHQDGNTSSMGCEIPLDG